MHIINKIVQAGGKTLMSFEILPPVLGRNYLHNLFTMVEGLMTMKPAFINITYHSRQQKSFVKNDNGFTFLPIKKRPGTIGICSAIKTKFQVETVPHIICTDHDAHEIEDKLIELNYLGIDNVLALRGDKLKHENTFNPKSGGHRYAVDLVRQMVKMNRGEYLDQHPGIHGQTNFCIGVAGYPEKHLEAKNYEEDLLHLKEKVDAGAHYVVTQMFFDNQIYFRFLEDCRRVGIDVPIIPGLKNLSRSKQIDGIQKIFATSIPDKLSKALTQAGSREEEERIGTEWCIQQSQELKDKGVPVIHYYTMGQVEQIKKIIEVVFP